MGSHWPPFGVLYLHLWRVLMSGSTPRSNEVTKSKWAVFLSSGPLYSRSSSIPSSSQLESALARLAFRKRFNESKKQQNYKKESENIDKKKHSKFFILCFITEQKKTLSHIH